MDGVEGFADCFIERGMRVDGMHQGFDGGFGFHGGDGFGDQLEGIGADDVDAQNLAEFFVRYDFDSRGTVAARRALSHVRD